MTDNNASEKTAREQARAAFEELGLQDKTGFLAEATFITFTEAVEVFSENVLEVISNVTKMWEKEPPEVAVPAE